MSFFSDYFGNSKKLRRVRNHRSARPGTPRRAQLDLQLLEDRTVPAVMSAFSGTSLSITLTAANDTAILSENTSGEIFVTDVVAGMTTDTTANISQLTGGISLLDGGTNLGQTVTFDSSSGAAIDLSPATLGGLTISGIETINVNSGSVKLPPGASSSDIDFHFFGGNASLVPGVMAPTDNGNTAGGTGGPAVLADTNWNNINNVTSTQSNLALHDSTGAATATTLSFVGTNAYGTASGVKILNGYLDNSGALAGGADTVTLTGVPYATYSVYVYFGSDTAGRTGSVAINGGTPIDFKTMGNTSTFVQTTDTTGAYPAANYAIFTGVTGANFTLSTLRAGPALGNNGISAVQIVPNVVSALSLTNLNVASGATFDTNGNLMTTSTLGGAGTITNSNATATSILTASTGTFGGTIAATGAGGKTQSLAATGTGIPSVPQQRRSDLRQRAVHRRRRNRSARRRRRRFDGIAGRHDRRQRHARDHRTGGQQRHPLRTRRRHRQRHDFGFGDVRADRCEHLHGNHHNQRRQHRERRQRDGAQHG